MFKLSSLIYYYPITSAAIILGKRNNGITLWREGNKGKREMVEKEGGGKGGGWKERFSKIVLFPSPAGISMSSIQPEIATISTTTAYI